MVFPERFSGLPEYAFPRLRALLDVHEPGGEVILMSLGEPRHAMPSFLVDIIAEHADGFGRYPTNEGMPDLLEACADWVERRYNVPLAADKNIMALNGTREGLFNSLIALCPEGQGGQKPLVLLPNPFYQVYAVAALALGAEPVYVAARAENGFMPDYASLPPDVLNRVEVAYICSPSNPQGAVASRDYWRDLFALAEKYDFKIFADECYSEIWRDTPPPGAIEVAREVGADSERLMIFHSLSKRSNLPGLRAGFIAGGPESIRRTKHLRSYAGSPMPQPLQYAAAACWRDEAHVDESRARYQTKFGIADDVLAGIDGWGTPEAGFFLWLPVEDGEATALRLWKETGVRVLPGAYFARDADGENPGHGYIRVAMVAQEDEMKAGLIRIRDCLYQ